MGTASALTFKVDGESSVVDDVHSSVSPNDRNTITDDNYKFYSGNSYSGMHAFYAAGRDALGIGNEISIDELRKQAIDYYFEHKEIDPYGWGINAQRQVLAKLYDIILCLISLNEQNDKEKSPVTIDFYDYRFYSIHAAGKENSTKPMKRFYYTDLIKNMIGDYIKDDLKYKDEINLDYDINMNEDERLIFVDVKMVVDSIINTVHNDANHVVPAGLLNTLLGLKDTTTIGWSSVIMEQPLESIPNEDPVSNKRMKITENSNDKVTTTSETCMSDVNVNDKFDQQQTGDSSMAINDFIEDND